MGHNKVSEQDKTSATTEAARNGVMNLTQDKTSGTTEAARNGVMILQDGDLGCGWGCERVIDPRESTPAIRVRGLSTLVQKSNAPTRRDRSLSHCRGFAVPYVLSRPTGAV